MLYYSFILILLLGLGLLLGGVNNIVRRRLGIKKVREIGIPLGWLPIIDNYFPDYQRLPYDLREQVQKATFFKHNDLLLDGQGSIERLSEEIKVAICLRPGLLYARRTVPPLQHTRTVIVATRREIDSLYPAVAPRVSPLSTLWIAWDESHQQPRCYLEEKNSEIMAHWHRWVEASTPDRDALFYAGWARSMWLEQPHLAKIAAQQCPELATDENLFPAATEAFLRTPRILLASHPSLYQALKHFFLFDPARWGQKSLVGQV